MWHCARCLTAAKSNDKTGRCREAQAVAGSRARVTSMGGLYDAATLRALMATSGCSTSKTIVAT